MKTSTADDVEESPPDECADHLAIGAMQGAEYGKAVGRRLVADGAPNGGRQLRHGCITVVILWQINQANSDSVGDTAGWL